MYQENELKRVLNIKGPPVIRSLMESVCHEDSEACSNTPNRWSDSMRELLAGYDMNPKLTRFAAETNDMVVKRRIKYYSLCRHHILPFFGHAYIAYIPDQWVLGLSKFSRVVEKYSRRLQIQETLTAEIAGCLIEALGTEDVMVVLTGEHLCEKMRGAENDTEQSNMVTSSVHGVFRNKQEARQEALSLMAPVD